MNGLAIAVLPSNENGQIAFLLISCLESLEGEQISWQYEEGFKKRAAAGKRTSSRIGYAYGIHGSFIIEIQRYAIPSF